ncbi:MAG: hypothetical protein ACYTBZ_20365, partial [Planctomycetota bacterium]
KVWILDTAKVWILDTAKVWILDTAKVWILDTAKVWILDTAKSPHFVESRKDSRHSDVLNTSCFCEVFTVIKACGWVKYAPVG